MPRGDKFLELTTYLKRTNKDVIPMTFGEIENILGFNLSKSAYTHKQYWSYSTTHTFPLSWMNAGYIAEQLDLATQTIVFRKEGVVKHAAELKKTSNNIKQTRVSTLPLNLALKSIDDYYSVSVEDPNGRYLSWVHCYKTFSENRKAVTNETIDYLALHLAFYLASWGMMRGGAFLLQKDYKIHIPVVRILLEEKYDSLCGISAEMLLENKYLNLLEDISVRIKDVYAKSMPAKENLSNNASETLITKILLGALGCVPAYDRYYKQTVKKYNISSGMYNSKSVKCIAKYYIANKDAFEKKRKKISLDVDYPPMKLMDMCMWQIAFADDKDNKKEL
ncbi:hypothetical protein M2145_001009 [Lachnospiraceae bacterium PF1-21]|uniref:DUF7662 domain-containing protein n=1 Tax=Ohessyouella blattaphilus TaxID=2949333 RepID=UPI003E23A29B